MSRQENDTIYRQATIKHLKHRLYETAMNNLDLAGVFSEIAENRIETWIEELPSAEPERKKGKWIAHPGGKFVGFPYMHYECDQCRAFEPTETNFCPSCGADMREEEE